MQAIFNMLGPVVEGARVIDLFAGSGALGIEALSRGAAHATFVERSEPSLAALRRNLAGLGLEAVARVARGDAARWVAANQAEVASAGLVLLDPPYGEPALAATLLALDTAVRPGAAVVAEHGAAQRLPELSRLEEVRARRYGDSALTIMRAR